jgi:hypothetical protein
MKHEEALLAFCIQALPNNKRKTFILVSVSSVLLRMLLAASEGGLRDVRGQPVQF